MVNSKELRRHPERVAVKTKKSTNQFECVAITFLSDLAAVVITLRYLHKLLLYFITRFYFRFMDAAISAKVIILLVFYAVT